METIECPECQATISAGARNCTFCGAQLPVIEVAVEQPAGRSCPRCRGALKDAAIGQTAVLACWTCQGIWLPQTGLAQLLADGARQEAVVRMGTPGDAAVPDENRRPALCPACGALLNRVVFAENIAVIVDQCPAHGIWFDRDELRQVVEGVLAGKLGRVTTAPPPATTGASCVGCGRQIDPAQGDITPDGLLCSKCALGSQISDHWERYAEHQRQRGYDDGWATRNLLDDLFGNRKL